MRGRSRFYITVGQGQRRLAAHGIGGTVCVVTASPEASGPAPFKWVENQYSLLDKTDLVFVDAPLCGFSRAVGKGTAKDFAGVDQDVKAFEKFITRYIDRKPAVELTEVFVWRELWDATLRGTGGCAEQRWDSVQRRGSAVINPELLRALSGV